MHPASLRPLTLCLLASGLSAQLPDRITPGALHRLDRVGLVVVSGTVNLPARLRTATLQPVPGEGVLERAFLVPPPSRPPSPHAGGASEEAPEEDMPRPLHGPDTPIPFQVLALRRGNAQEARLNLVDASGKVVTTLRFTLPTSPSREVAPAQTWARMHVQAWSNASVPLQAGLAAAAASAYGVEPISPKPRSLGRPVAPRDQGPSLLAVLGGRAAVDETLQLDRSLTEADKDRTLQPLSSLKPVDIPAHPWATMAKVRAVPASLADCVPLDRALLLLPRPKEALASLEGGGASFLQRVNSFSGQGRLDTAIVARLMADLGLGSGLGRRLVEAGAITSAVLILPDLALLAGTEATLVAELAPLASTLLPIPEGPIAARPAAHGEAFWARRGTRIFLSTSRTELQRVLALHEAGGKGSLGRSDEYAVVLEHLAPTQHTEAFAYLPDAFIRSLVGPRQRILQLRQAKARAAMEGLAAAAFLRRMDAPKEPCDLARLQALGYVPRGLDLTDLSLEADGRVRHRTFGPLERLVPLARLPLTSVTTSEAKAYGAFRAAYDQYWRRYFDPIAFRLEAGPEGGMALETFVLPLLEHSLYASFRGLFPGNTAALPRPAWTHPMVATFATKVPLADRHSRSIRLLEDLVGAPARLFTGALTVGFPDAAPVIQVGGGSPANLMDARLDGRSDVMTFGALALGLFTRPMAVALELKAPAAVASDLEAALALQELLPTDLQTQVSREPDGRVVLSTGLFGLVGMRFTARVEDRWLVLSNDVALPSPLVSGTQPDRPFHAAFTLNPGALRLGLPSAWHAAQEGEAKAAWQSMAWLSPWLGQGLDVPAAQAESRRLLGMAPALEPDSVLPGPIHRTFGTPRQALRPPFDPTRDFGVFEGVREAQVEMRLEGEGLRARVSWKR